MGPLWRQPRWLDILGLRLPAGQTGIGRAWPGKWRPFPRSGPGMSGRAIGQTLYYGAGHAESNCLLLTLVSRPGKTVSLEGWGRSGAGLSLPTCWAEMTESSGEGMCHAGVQRRWGWAPDPHWRGAQSAVGGTGAVPLAPPELLGRAGAELAFSGRSHLNILERRWELQTKPLPLPR